MLTPAHDLVCKEKKFPFFLSVQHSTCWLQHMTWSARGKDEETASKSAVNAWTFTTCYNNWINTQSKWKHSLLHLIQERVCRCLLCIPDIFNALFWLLPSTLFTRLQVALPTPTSKFAFSPPIAHTHFSFFLRRRALWHPVPNPVWLHVVRWDFYCLHGSFSVLFIQRSRWFYKACKQA